MEQSFVLPTLFHYRKEEDMARRKNTGIWKSGDAIHAFVMGEDGEIALIRPEEERAIEKLIASGHANEHVVAVFHGGSPKWGSRFGDTVGLTDEQRLSLQTVVNERSAAVPSGQRIIEGMLLSGVEYILQIDRQVDRTTVRVLNTTRNPFTSS